MALFRRRSGSKLPGRRKCRLQIRFLQPRFRLQRRVSWSLVSRGFRRIRLLRLWVWLGLGMGLGPRLGMVESVLALAVLLVQPLVVRLLARIHLSQSLNDFQIESSPGAPFLRRSGAPFLPRPFAAEVGNSGSNQQDSMTRLSINRVPPKNAATATSAPPETSSTGSKVSAFTISR